jgi:hypothetical protein
MHPGIKENAGPAIFKQIAVGTDLLTACEILKIDFCHQ